MTESQVEAQNNVVEPTPEVKEDYVPEKTEESGITKFKEQPQPEISSPFRKKKKFLGQLQTSNI